MVVSQNTGTPIFFQCASLGQKGRLLRQLSSSCSLYYSPYYWDPQNGSPNIGTSPYKCGKLGVGPLGAQQLRIKKQSREDDQQSSDNDEDETRGNQYSRSVGKLNIWGIHKIRMPFVTPKFEAP